MITECRGTNKICKHCDRTNSKEKTREISVKKRLIDTILLMSEAKLPSVKPNEKKRKSQRQEGMTAIA